ncbi:MAG: DUF4301 family protein [Bacteroidales bacterium]|nr:DUF4301 family protein [Bacteroidales bacterium]
MLSKEDLSYLKNFGISEETANEQIELLKKTDSFLSIYAPATIENGIKSFDKIDKFLGIFDNSKDEYQICKFVPASGAATRMFKRLISYHQNPNFENLNEGDNYSVKYCFDNINEFAFHQKLKSCNIKIEAGKELAEAILYSCLGYAGIPKGLIEFHNYSEGSRTAFEEHLHEAIAIDPSRKTDIHLTVSPEFVDDFKTKLKEIQTKTGIILNVSFSVQEKSTDTIALYNDGEIVRDQNENVMLRPGGHGALLQNLNKIDADIVFVKNIDNLTHTDYLDETIAYKKLLGGILIDILDKTKTINKTISGQPTPTEIEYAKSYLETEFGAVFGKTPDIKKEILEYINRPIRVCGMVKNTGEPGGGPFWVQNKNNSTSLQIVEKAQINLNDSTQQQHFNNATHFNPVDMVCYLKDQTGKKIDLNKYVDKNACFISDKTYNGKNIKVLEHPGLWNGAMSDWLTVFVEVPLETFNPVKELNDLLRKMHQPKKK